MKALTWREVWGRRLRRHFLHEPAPRTHVVEVVRGVCGIHAQMMPAAEMSLGIRVAQITRQDIRAALWEERSLVKTYGVRGTVHLFPADDLPLWMAALRVKQDAREEKRLLGLGLTPDQRDAVVAAIGDSLDRRCLTREELGEEVGRRAGSWALEAVSPAFGSTWPRWQMAVGHAALAGLLCFGPNRGAKVTYVRPDQWLGGWEEIDGASALRTVFKRYLAAYGPATSRDFAQWFAMRPGTAAQLVRDMAGELEEVDVEGYRAWLPAGEEPEPPASDPGTVHLLPHFDCYVVGMHPRDRLVEGEWRAWSKAHGGAGNHPAVLIGGVLRGIWLYRRKGDRLELRVDVFRPLNPRENDGMEAAAARIGEIMEATPEFILGPITPRPHL